MTLAPAVTPLPALRTWLTDAELLLRDMNTADPRYAAGFEIWNARHEQYMARVLTAGEPA